VKIRDAVKIAAPAGVPTPGAFHKAGEEPKAPAAEEEPTVVEAAAEAEAPAAEEPAVTEAEAPAAEAPEAGEEAQ
jgi:hypothetical protein